MQPTLSPRILSARHSKYEAASRSSRQDLKLERAFVVHPGGKSFPLNDWAESVAIGDLARTIAEIS